MATPKTPAKPAAKTAAKTAANTKAEKFVTLGQKRVGAAIHKIRLVRNLANRASYDFDAAQVEKIKAALVAEVEALDERFQLALAATSEAPAKEAGFTF